MTDPSAKVYHYDYEIQAWVDDLTRTVQKCGHSPFPSPGCTACKYAGQDAATVRMILASRNAPKERG